MQRLWLLLLFAALLHGLRFSDLSSVEDAEQSNEHMHKDEQGRDILPQEMEPAENEQKWTHASNGVANSHVTVEEQLQQKVEKLHHLSSERTAAVDTRQNWTIASKGVDGIREGKVPDVKSQQDGTDALKESIVGLQERIDELSEKEHQWETTSRTESATRGLASHTNVRHKLHSIMPELPYLVGGCLLGLLALIAVLLLFWQWRLPLAHHITPRSLSDDRTVGSVTNPNRDGDENDDVWGSRNTPEELRAEWSNQYLKIQKAWYESNPVQPLKSYRKRLSTQKESPQKTESKVSRNPKSSESDSSTQKRSKKVARSSLQVNDADTEDHHDNDLVRSKKVARSSLEVNDADTEDNHDDDLVEESSVASSNSAGER